MKDDEAHQLLLKMKEMDKPLGALMEAVRADRLDNTLKESLFDLLDLQFQTIEIVLKAHPDLRNLDK